MHIAFSGKPVSIKTYYYILFDEDKKTATILNEFENTVTTIENVTTTEEVDNFLNGKEIVKAEEEIEELEKTSEEEIIDDILKDM